ncbi:uncharacterized protein [Oscarella lobularis]|uniref:uncharacterized protein n=1 Tax=Oscarella lobularis TaxID=121494 RepID=UPI003313A531
MLLYIQAVASFSPKRIFEWKPKSDDPLITSSPSVKQSSVIDVQATSFPTNKSSGNVRDDASQSTTTSFCTNTTSIPTDEDPLNIKQRNVTIFRVVTHETKPSQEPKEFKLCTYPEKQLLGTDKRGIARKNPKKTTTFMIVQYGKGEFVLCAIRGRRRYIASLDETTNGIQLHCTAEMGFMKKNKACKNEIKRMGNSEVAPYLFTLT